MIKRIEGQPSVPDTAPVPDTTERSRRVERPEKTLKVEDKKPEFEQGTKIIESDAGDQAIFSKKGQELAEDNQNPDNIEEENTVSDPEGLPPGQSASRSGAKTRRDKEETQE